MRQAVAVREARAFPVSLTGFCKHARALEHALVRSRTTDLEPVCGPALLFCSQPRRPDLASLWTMCALRRTAARAYLFFRTRNRAGRLKREDPIVEVENIQLDWRDVQVQVKRVAAAASRTFRSVSFAICASAVHGPALNDFLT